MNKKILIVDDEPQITDMLSKHLTLDGYDTTTCNNPIEAWKMVQTNDYSVVVTDIVMPQMNGLDLLEKTKKFDGLIQVIVITGYVTMDNILNAFRSGANNCFFKPFENLVDLKKEIDFAFEKMQRVHAVLRERSKYKEDSESKEKKQEIQT